MYTPKFNSVLVEIDDQDAKWGTGNDDSMLGKSYSKGKVVSVAPEPLSTPDHPAGNQLETNLTNLIGKDIMWNEGTEAGTLFEEEGKLYGFIYWWDIRGIKNV